MSAMSALSSRATYESRMHRVLEHIDRNIDAPLDLSVLAAVANFSSFHFHRLFTAWTGERVGDYVRRRRLEIAASRLSLQPDSSVLSIALAVGFGSSEAFTRSFKLRFGDAPGVWRKRQGVFRSGLSNPGHADSKLNHATEAEQLDDRDSPNQTSEVTMQVRVITRAAVSVAYLRHTGPYGESIDRFWKEKVEPWLATNGLQANARYGISHDDPGVTSPGKCRYDAAVEVGADVILSGKAQRTVIPAGRYAVLDFWGTTGAIGEAWASLIRNWLPASGLQLDQRPCFEFYPQDSAFDAGTGEFACQICIPVMSL